MGSVLRMTNCVSECSMLLGNARSAISKVLMIIISCRVGSVLSVSRQGVRIILQRVSACSVKMDTDMSTTCAYHVKTCIVSSAKLTCKPVKNVL